MTGPARGGAKFVVAAPGDRPAGGRPRRRPWWEVMHPDDAKGSFRDLPRLLADSLRLVWAAGRTEFLIVATLQLLTAFGYAAQLFIGKEVLDAVLAAEGAADFTALLPQLAALVAVTVAIDFAAAVEAEKSRVLSELVGRRAFERVLDVSTRIDLLAFESPDFYDRLTRARAQGQFRSMQTVNGLLGLVGATVAAAGIVLALAALQPLLVPLVLLGYVPLWLVASRNTRDLYEFTHGMTPNERQRMYLQQLLTRRGSATEVRAFGTAGFLRERYDRLYDERIRELRALARRRTVRSLLGALASSAVTAGTIAALAFLYVSERMSLGETGAAVFGLYQLSGRLRALHFSAAALYEAMIFIRDYASFLAFDPAPEPSVLASEPAEGVRRNRDGLSAGGAGSADARPAAESHATRRTFDRITVEGVSFAYPDTDRNAVDGVSLEINRGDVVALVGENGSGKTTLAKLVAGLYRADAGRVLWDGVDVDDIDQDALRDSVAVIFQDFQQYLLPARENVGMGRHQRIDDHAAVVEAARHADADEFLAALPEGYETMLGREFAGGWDLSIGQWQRVALARAFFRDAPLVILDEPTASLDARAESNLFDRIRDLLSGRSVLLISHRFSSVRSADRIYVLEDGRVAEHGSHDELMRLGGHYAELFTLQARAYLDGRR